MPLIKNRLTSILENTKILNVSGELDISRYEDAKRMARIMDALSSPIRLLIVCMLLEGERNVGDIISKIGTSSGNISQHLRILEDTSILISRKEGNKVFYSIKNPNIKRLIKEIKRLCDEKGDYI